MFGFFRKKKKDNDEKSNLSPEESINAVTAQTTAETVTTETQQAALRYAKPATYTGHRDLYDSAAGKRNAKLELFASGKNVVDSYTGERLVLTKNEAKALYGDEWTKHLAETDHVKPLEQIHNDTKNNAWNTTEDIKAAANSNDNYAVASRKFNNPKRSRTNEEYVQDKEYLKEKGVKLTTKGKRQAIKDGELAETSINEQLQSSAIKNVLETGHTAGVAGAKYAGVTGLTMSGIQNVVSVIKGEKEASEALADTVKIGGQAAVTGYAVGGVSTVVLHTLSNSSSKFIQALGKSNVPANIITSIMVTGSTLKKWGEGDITTQECLIELGDKGLSFVNAGYSMAIGQALIPIPIVGGAVGALVGIALTSSLYRNLISQLKGNELEEQRREQIIRECREVAAQTKAYREELEKTMESHFKAQKDCFDVAIASMKFAFQSGDADTIIAGANTITRELGGVVQYETVEEYKAFLDSDEKFIL